MPSEQPNTIYLKDYKAPEFSIESVALDFQLSESHAIVTNTMRIIPRAQCSELVLFGDALQCDGVTLNAKEVAYDATPERLVVTVPQEAFELKVITRIYPQDNKELEGLYRSNNMFCTQCEPEGFRRITYYLDRPDVLSSFTTRIEADKARYPVLLSNGNKIASGDVSNGRHYALFEDPFAKPSYLFALVAGDLALHHETFTTMSGREVACDIYVESKDIDKTAHAMRSLKAAMKWDEEQYGREYDLDTYSIVAVDSFNMGAMENKGLNIFNAAYVLADAKSATDQNYIGIESVIAHEYFHNWTGNRITCRDWFQLTLKEGLTVFRDQCFSADMNSEALHRIFDVQTLRDRQFVEDASPTAHPIKPKSYMEINNFYTATIYEKGAEVIRMLHTLVGKEAFRKGCDNYFATFDGQAVRTEDFIDSFRPYSEIDFDAFSTWYDAERTPVVTAEVTFDAARSEILLQLRQELPKRVDGTTQAPLYMPIRYAFLTQSGDEVMPVRCDDALAQGVSGDVLILNQSEQLFRFRSDEPLIVSLNRHFSAPVILKTTPNENAFLMRYERDGFNRFEAVNNMAIDAILRGEYEAFVDAFSTLLDGSITDLRFLAELITLPSDTTLISHQDVIDMVKISNHKRALKQALLHTYSQQMEALYLKHLALENFDIDAQSMGERALSNALLGYLALDSANHHYVEAHYFKTKNMTLRIKALLEAENCGHPQLSLMQEDFYETFKANQLVMSKYITVLAGSTREGVLERVKAFQSDAVFDLEVPNLVRALFGTFSRNLAMFHADDGSGYAFIADKVVALNSVNPMIAAGLCNSFNQYQRLNSDAKGKMASALQMILNTPNLSKNVYEIASKIYDN